MERRSSRQKSVSKPIVHVTEKITPIQAWNIATTMKLHFEGKLDAVKYRFSMKNLTAKSFEGRKDRYHFEKLARKHSDLNECIWYCASNVMSGNKWIGDMNEEPYVELRAYHESMNYRFEQEIKALAESGEKFDDLLMDITGEGKAPRLLQSYASGKSSIHLIAIIQALTGFLREMPKVKDPLRMWEEHATRVSAYSKILVHNLDAPTFKRIVISAFTV